MLATARSLYSQGNPHDVVDVVVVGVGEGELEGEGDFNNLLNWKKFENLAWSWNLEYSWKKIFPPKNQQRVAKFFCSNPTIH